MISSDPVVARWTRANPIYRRPPKVWRLSGHYDREQVMRNVRALSPKPPRPGSDTMEPMSGREVGGLAELTRHLVIDGYDRPSRRWALERRRRGINNVFFVGGLLVAAAFTYLVSGLGGQWPNALYFVSMVELVGAVAVLMLAFLQILPIATASVYARRWLDHMPCDRSPPRYRRLYD